MVCSVRGLQALVFRARVEGFSIHAGGFGEYRVQLQSHIRLQPQARRTDIKRLILGPKTISVFPDPY